MPENLCFGNIYISGFIFVDLTQLTLSGSSKLEGIKNNTLKPSF